MENLDFVGFVGYCEDFELSRKGIWYDRFLKDFFSCVDKRFFGSNLGGCNCIREFKCLRLDSFNNCER